MKTKRESSEDYLETILVLSKENACVRAIDIARALSFSKPSVSIALKKLLKQKLISIAEESSCVFLTDKGRSIAAKTLERHMLLTDWFISIGVDPLTAENDACRIEHDLSDSTWAAIKRHSAKERHR